MAIQVRHETTEVGVLRTPGGVFVASENGRTVGVLRYTDTDSGTLHLELEGPEAAARLLLDAAVEEARRRGVKLVAIDADLARLLESDELRDVRASGPGERKQRELVTVVPEAMRAMLERIDLLRAPPDGDDEDDEGWIVRTEQGSAQRLAGGAVRIHWCPEENVYWDVELPLREVREIITGASNRLRVSESVRSPEPLEAVADAEEFLDDLVADGSIELAGGDEPRARHAQVFAMAERLAVSWAEWRRDRASLGEHAATFGAWLLDQREVDDVFIDDRDLALRLHDALSRRA